MQHQIASSNKFPTNRSSNLPCLSEKSCQKVEYIPTLIWLKQELHLGTWLVMMIQLTSPYLMKSDLPTKPSVLQELKLPTALRWYIAIHHTNLRKHHSCSIEELHQRDIPQVEIKFHTEAPIWHSSKKSAKQSSKIQTIVVTKSQSRHHTP